MKVFIALLALALPMGLVLLHPSTGRSLDWQASDGHRTVGSAAPQHLASR